MTKVFLRHHAVAIVRTALSFLGTLWLMLRVTLFAWPGAQALVERTATRLPWLPLLLCLIAAVVAVRPRMSVLCHFDKRDLDIEVRLGDMFSVEGDYVVSTNTTFDTSVEGGLISPLSVQGQFTRRFYVNVGRLDADIERALQEAAGKSISVSPPRKTRRYPVGTVAKISVESATPRRGGFAYLIAIDEIDSSGTLESSFEMLHAALSSLWVYVNEQGGAGRVVTGLLGSGHARVPVSQERILREMIDSFIACSAQRKVCDRLTIVVRPGDYLRNRLSLTRMSRYLDHVRAYGPLADPLGPGTG